MVFTFHVVTRPSLSIRSSTCYNCWKTLIIISSKSSNNKVSFSLFSILHYNLHYKDWTSISPAKVTFLKTFRIVIQL